MATRDTHPITGAGAGAGSLDGTGTNRSGGNSDTASIGNPPGTGETPKAQIPSFGETIQVIEAEPKGKRGRKPGSKNSTPKSNEDDEQIQLLFVMIIESMFVQRFGQAATFTKQEKDILDKNFAALMEKIGLSKKLENSPIINVAMIMYVFFSVGMRVRANTVNEDLSQYLNPEPVHETPEYDIPTRSNGNGSIHSSEIGDLFNH